MSHSSYLRAARRASHRGLRILTVSLLGSAAALGLALTIEACGSGETSGDRVALDTRVELEPNAQAFTTAMGWDVTLSRVLISTGPFYYFDGAPPLVQREPEHRWPARPARSTAWPSSLEALGLSSALAHPGHYEAGDALGQMLSPWSIDLLAGPADLPVGDGVTGVYRSASFSFTSPPEGPLAGAMESQAAIAEGIASRQGGDPVHFVAMADLADVERSAANGYVDGCEFEELDIERAGRVTVRVNPKIWFDLVDFGELAPAGDAAVPFGDDSQPKIAFALGLAQLSAYKFSFSVP
ncbi:MAG TPA: hypothetical protein VMG12_40680 [Polyangiaceae bacterium]|nr:hypothetical protein [Polyangiaceae bacterium]